MAAKRSTSPAGSKPRAASRAKSGSARRSTAPAKSQARSRSKGRLSARASARPATRPVQLRWLAHARSGDKGNTANVGLIALRPEYYPLLVKEVTPARVKRHFKKMIGTVERFELPNLGALNFLLHDALDGGGTLSLKTDAQGKVYSTALLRMEIPVPLALARTLNPAK